MYLAKIFTNYKQHIAYGPDKKFMQIYEFFEDPEKHHIKVNGIYYPAILKFVYGPSVDFEPPKKMTMKQIEKNMGN